MSEQIRVNVEHIESIFVMDGADLPVTGLVQANFGISLSSNGTTSAVPVTIDEVDAVANPGEYSVSWTPTTLGIWVVRVRHAVYEPMGWEGEYEVVLASVGEPSEAELLPSITAGIATSSSVEADIWGYEVETYEVELLDSDGITVDTTSRVGSGKVTLTPSTSGAHTISVVGVDGNGNINTATVTMDIGVPSA